MTDVPEPPNKNMRWWYRLMELEDKLAETQTALTELLETNLRLWEQNSSIQQKADALRLLEQGALQRMNAMEDKLRLIEDKLGIVDDLSDKTMKRLEQRLEQGPKGYVDDQGYYHSYREEVMHGVVVPIQQYDTSHMSTGGPQPARNPSTIDEGGIIHGWQRKFLGLPPMTSDDPATDP